MQLNLSHLPRILFVDDDALFGALMSRLAEKGKIPLCHVTSPREINLVRLKETYDIMILDYELQNVSGIQLVRSFEVLSLNIPTLLISSYSKLPNHQLPSSVISFMHKSNGPQAILWSAIKNFRGSEILHCDLQTRIKFSSQT